MAATATYPRPLFATVDDLRVGMIVLTFSGRRLRIEKLDGRRGGIVHYSHVNADPFNVGTHFAGVAAFATIVESVLS